MTARQKSDLLALTALLIFGLAAVAQWCSSDGMLSNQVATENQKEEPRKVLPLFVEGAEVKITYNPQLITVTWEAEDTIVTLSRIGAEEKYSVSLSSVTENDSKKPPVWVMIGWLGEGPMYSARADQAAIQQAVDQLAQEQVPHNKEREQQ